MTLLLISMLLALTGQQSRPPVVVDYDGRTPLPVGVAAPERQMEPRGRPPILPLPDGELKAFSENRRAVHFIATDSLRRDGDRVRVNYYTVFWPAAPSGDRLIAHWITEVRVDCVGGTTQSIRLSAYDEAGDEVLWLPADPVERIEPGSLAENLQIAACRPNIPPTHRSVVGWRDALSFGRSRLGG